MYVPEDSDEEFELNIVPMIDVIFAILTFFIISSLFLTRSESLPVNLPTAENADVQERTHITVTVDAEGNLALNREPVTLDSLKSEILDLMATAQESVIVIHADEAVNHGRVIAIMDQLRTIKGAALAIATTQR